VDQNRLPGQLKRGERKKGKTPKKPHPPELTFFGILDEIKSSQKPAETRSEAPEQDSPRDFNLKAG